MAVSFLKDRAAEKLHQQGLAHALTGDFSKAHSLLADARRTVHESSITYDLPSRLLQLAGIERDNAFTFTREAIAADNPSLLDPSYRKLFGVRDSTATLVKQGKLAFTSEDWAHLESEHGANLDLMFRVATVNKVIFNSAVSVIPVPEKHLAGDPEWDAWQHLPNGSNRYFSASHAMNVARYEFIEGRAENVALWVHRAVLQLPAAIAYDPSNVIDVARTIVGRRHTTRDMPTALASVSSRP